MKRLTKRYEDGMAYVSLNKVSALNDECVGLPITKLARYEDLEEQGLLLKLPCKVGDALYRIDTVENTEIECFTIDNIVICKDGDVLFKYDAYDGIICHLENIITDKLHLDFYKVFLTQDEAEEALKGMEENK